MTLWVISRDCLRRQKKHFFYMKKIFFLQPMVTLRDDLCLSWFGFFLFLFLKIKRGKVKKKSESKSIFQCPSSYHTFSSKRYSIVCLVLGRMKGRKLENEILFFFLLLFFFFLLNSTTKKRWNWREICWHATFQFSPKINSSLGCCEGSKQALCVMA